MPRFFIPPTQLNTDAHTVTVLGEDARHIARSLRMAVGEDITVADGSGMIYSCRLSSIHDEEVVAEILVSARGESEPPYDLTLYMAYPKGDKLETVIQKAVELGATRVVPFESERCIKRPAAEKKPRITERLNRIACEAAKQCGRARLPVVESPISFSQMLDRAKAAALPLFCYEGTGTVSLMLALPKTPPVSVAVVIGCEGGFSPAEASHAKEAGLFMVNLGPRILRCETAPDYVLSALSCHFELENP